MQIEKLHKVKKAIIMAAGMGTRMQPLTFERPKPLIRVNGIRIIDTAVDCLRKNGIREIYVVVGYLKEQFYLWAIGKKDVHIIENPFYETCNNISSLYVAREHLGECIILDGDQIIYNQAILNPHFTRSEYNVIWCEKKTNEWLLQVKDGVITSCSRSGGTKGWQLFSISRWTAEDGEKLRNHLQFEFERGNRTIYWDDIVMFLHFDEYRLGIREMQKKDVMEIDNLEELIKIDNSYENYKKRFINESGDYK